MTEQGWQPGASLALLRARAGLLAALRDFFRRQGVLEVETPLLCSHAGTDPQLAAMAVPLAGSTRYLQTSPEFAMKRLLAAGIGPIYQISKAFRAGDEGRRHNPEFSLLEWYRPGVDEQGLMDEVALLVGELLGLQQVRRLSYRELFQRHLGLDPHQAPLDTLQALARRELALAFDDPDRNLWLDLLYSHLIEPELRGACFIYDYPASQAALAQLHEDAQGQVVARRFELVIDGLELANGYFELCDPEEQAQRFRQDQQQRVHKGLPPMAADPRFLAALEAGLPSCAGVALGLDRLLMLQQGQDDIDTVLSFSARRC